MSDLETAPVEMQLVRNGMLFEDVEILESKVAPTVGDEDWHVRIEFQVDEELVETCALGLIFVLGLLSFHDGRPRGSSGAWFEDDDEFTAQDMVRHLKLKDGRLHVYVDYLRGRCIKTTIEVGSDGRGRLETVNRGKSALRWLDRVKGRAFLQVVAS